MDTNPHSTPGPSSADEAAEAFRRAWQTYRKLVDCDYFYHRRVHAELEYVLRRYHSAPFRFVDLACGDAAGVAEVLRKFPVAHYRGVDLAESAIGRAQENLKVLECEVRLELADLTTALRGATGAADVVWLSLSLHHLATPDKQAVMRDICAALNDAGSFLLYEPILLPGESRQQYLARFQQINRPLWTELSDDQWQFCWEHVRERDFPETATKWLELGREAGFASAEPLFVDERDLYQLFLFR